MSKRNPQYPANQLFVNRWSPRAMSGQDISDQELLTLFEAARWAPSSFNNQPWRFLYAKKKGDYWDLFFNLLDPGNQLWVKNAGVLILIISRKNFEFNNKPSRTHSFDTGSAWENLALQGELNNLVVHGLEGFDYDRARKELNIPDDFDIEAMVAVGKPGNKQDLPEKMQRTEEPSDRKPIEALIAEGYFTDKLK